MTSKSVVKRLMVQREKPRQPIFFHVRLIDLVDPEERSLLPGRVREAFYSKGMTFAFAERLDGWYFGSWSANGKASFNRLLGRDVSGGRLSVKERDVRRGRLLPRDRAEFFGKERPSYEDVLVLFDFLNYEKARRSYWDMIDKVIALYPFQQVLASQVGQPAIEKRTWQEEALLRNT